MRGADNAQVTGISMKNAPGSHVTTRVSDTQRLGYCTALRNDLSWP